MSVIKKIFSGTFPEAALIYPGTTIPHVTVDYVKALQGDPFPEPQGSILHWDANTDPYLEKAEFGHTFNYNVLGPQYELQADGGYIDVGAKPAVDTFDGEKWLRSCGAVTNLLPSGSEDLTTWTPLRTTVAITGLLTPQGDIAYRVTANSDLTSHRVYCRVVTPVGSYTVRLLLKKDTTRYAQVTISNQQETTRIGVLVDFDLKTISLAGGSGRYTLEEQDGGWFLVTLSGDTISGDGSVAIFVYVRDNSGGGAFAGATEAVLVGSPQLTATPYPVPYVPPGVTQPASNATTTNGVWFANPDGSPLWKALTGEPLTLATRVRMGVTLGDMPTGDYRALICNNELNYGANNLLAYGSHLTLGPRFVIARDGINYAMVTPGISWARFDTLVFTAQTNTMGTQFRVGYMIEGTHTTIQWSVWVEYDGSFDPSTLYRLMLGYNNPYPMWFNKITAWKEEVSDARILNALSS